MISRDELLRRMKWAILAILAGILASIIFTGCTQTQERSVRIREGVEQGKPTRWVEREQSESKTQVVDPQAIGAAVAEAVKGAVPGADALVAAFKAATPSADTLASAFRSSAPAPQGKDWMQTASELALLAGTGAAGYVALKQRERNKYLPKGNK